jgi:PAS domain S-box-containing protein
MANSGEQSDAANGPPLESFAPTSNEPLLREAADSTPAPVWMTNKDGAVEFMNRAFSELTGIPREEALGDAWLAVLHPDDIAVVREKRAAAWEAGHAPYTFEARFRGHDGQWRWFEVSSKPRLDAEGKFHGYVGLAVDRTEARAAQQALAESERLYRLVVESQDALVVRFRNDGTIIFANALFARGRGKSSEDLIGTNLWDPIPEADRAERRALLGTLSPDAPEYRVEMRFHTLDGERWMLWTTRALSFDDEGRWLEAQSTGVDIHDLKQGQEHTRLLLNELNHRVKNTLAVVQGIARQTFKNVAPAARRAFEGRLAALSKAHNLLTERRWAPAPMHAVIDDVTHVCGAARARIHASGPDLFLSPRQAVSIAMALHELCTNAVKYGALSAEAGRVELAWDVEEGEQPRLALVWRERDGPPVRQPKRRGYGSRMIERALAHDLQGSATIEFDEAGLVCRINAPLDA